MVWIVSLKQTNKKRTFKYKNVLSVSAYKRRNMANYPPCDHKYFIIQLACIRSDKVCLSSCQMSTFNLIVILFMPGANYHSY